MAVQVDMSRVEFLAHAARADNQNFRIGGRDASELV